MPIKIRAMLNRPHERPIVSFLVTGFAVSAFACLPTWASLVLRAVQLLWPYWWLRTRVMRQIKPGGSLKINYSNLAMVFGLF